MTEAGLDVTLDVQGEPRPLPHGMDLNAYRTVHESLTNVLKHGGPDVRATVIIGYRANDIKSELVADTEGQIDQMLVLFTGLLFLAIIIAVLGITNTLTLAIIERAREIGLFLRWAVVRALAQEGLGSFAVPIGQIAILVLLAGVAGVIAAIYPSWKASQVNVLDAIAYE